MQDITDFKHYLRTDTAAQVFLADNRAEKPLTLARAPGRLDVMGGVADYSGSLVAEMTIAEAALVALAPRTDRTLRVWSRDIEAEGLTPQVSCSLEDFYSNGSLLCYEAVHSHLCADPLTRWSAYVFGCAYVLLAEAIVSEFPHGANIILDSRVPLGAGVSSSAAIEVATMQALSAAYGLNLDGVTVARLAQMVENKVVGAPCGIMDQMTSALGSQNSLLLILCQPHEVQGTQALPDSVRIFGINSNVRHSVGGSAYTRARVAAFMGRKILGVNHLADLAFREGRNPLINTLPTNIMGADFEQQWGETGDLVTHIDLEAFYNVHAATLHGIREHARVALFTSVLRNVQEGTMQLEGALTLAGQAMYGYGGSHASYTSIGLGCPETDLLVELGRAAGPDKGIYGAKITGGGSGGTVAYLTYGEQSEQTIHEIADTYQQQTGLMPQIFIGGQSPGAMAFGSEQI
ncbi:MAG: galactokinase [Janthinobacterium lividum]